MHIEISNRQSILQSDESRISAAVAKVLIGEGIQEAEINIAIVTNSQIHETNRRFLNHDFATDVITFPMNDDIPADTSAKPPPLQGDIMVSAEYAVDSAANYDWSPDDELLLYIVHGTLHLAGYDDRTDIERQIMREKESQYLSLLGLAVPDNHTKPAENGGTP